MMRMMCVSSRFYFGLFFILGAISTQRFFLAEIYAFVPFLSLIAAIAFLIANSKSFFFYFSFLALITSVDNGGDIYNETPAVIRYISYIFCILSVFSVKTVKSTSLLLTYLLWLSFIFLLTLINADKVIFNSSFHSFFILILIFLTFVIKSDSVQSINIHHLVYPAMLGAILGEIINIALVFNIVDGYLNYNSLKSLILYPVIYSLLKRRFFNSLILVSLTMVILVFYVTRMILLSFMLVLLIIFLRYVLFYKIKSLFLTFALVPLLFVSSIYIEIDNIDYSAYKVTSMVGHIFTNDNTDITDLLKTLDPVRFGELQVLLESNFINQLFGNGIGTSYHDMKNTFGFVGKYDYAFSEAELDTRVFFNFHDLWTDVGYRIGLLPLFVLFFWIVKSFFDTSEVFYSSNCLILVILLFCSFFSTAGLILIFMFISHVLENKKEDNKGLVND